MMVDTRIRRCLILFLLVVVGPAAPGLLVQAEGGEPRAPDAGYAITWWTVDGGGVTSLSIRGPYALTGTIGQPDAGAQDSGRYAIAGGFWAGLPGGVTNQIYLPLVVRNAGP
jgi:hypothetical protein